MRPGRGAPMFCFWVESFHVDVHGTEAVSRILHFKEAQYASHSDSS